MFYILKRTPIYYLQNSLGVLSGRTIQIKCNMLIKNEYEEKSLSMENTNRQNYYSFFKEFI